MYFDELEKGMKRELSPVTVDREEMLGFALKYDNVPVHTDDEYARGTHFGQIIAPGYFSFLLVWEEYLKKDFWGEQLIAGRSSKTEWFLPVFAGDTLTATAEITGLESRSERNGTAQITIEVFNQNGDMVLENVTEAVVKKKRQ